MSASKSSVSWRGWELRVPNIENIYSNTEICARVIGERVYRENISQLFLPVLIFSVIQIQCIGLIPLIPAFLSKRTFSCTSVY